MFTPTPVPPGRLPGPRRCPHRRLSPEQGWSLLCNGVIVFDDMGEILPDDRAIPPHSPAHAQLAAAA